MNAFACQHSTAAPEPLPDSNLVMVRHGAGCEVLIAQTRARWPVTQNASRLPATPAQIPFEQRAAFGRVASHRAGTGETARSALVSQAARR
jgi:hypothetical protein